MSSMYPSSGGATARPCMRCSAPLAPNESQCSRCGIYNPLPHQGKQFQPGIGHGTSGLAWGSQVAQTPPVFPPTNNPGSPASWGSTGQGGGWPQNNLFTGQNQQSSPSQQLPQGPFPASPGAGHPGQGQSVLNNPNQSALNNSFASFQPNPNQSMLNNPNQPVLNNSFAPFRPNPNQSSLNNSVFNNATQQNGYGTSQPGTGMLSGPQRNWQAYQANQRGNSGRDEDDNPEKRPNVFVLVGIIALVLLLIGGGAYGALYFLRHHGSSNNTGTTLSSVVTPSVTPLFSDSFQNNNNGWDTTQPTGTSITLARDGKLVLEDDNNKLLQEIVPGGKTFNDLRVDVDANLTKGDQSNGYGIYIRGALNSDGILGTYYCFEVYGDGNFAVYKGSQNADGTASRTPLQSQTSSTAILYAGQTNHLTVIAQGTQMTFQINGTTLYTFNDNSYKGGSVALFVSNVPGAKPGAQAFFERLAIFPVS